MLQWAIIFLVIALIAGAFAFRSVGSAAAGIAKVLFFLFLVVSGVTLALGLLGG